jgi:hypothetical protein
MAVSMNAKPRVIQIGESSGDLEADAALRAVADVVILPRMDTEESAVAIKQAVESGGPIVALAVRSCPSYSTIEDRGSGSEPCSGRQTRADE